MGKSKKIVLFIVEGVTDKNSLALILSKIIEKDKIVRFKIINGDMTAENGVNASNILTKITNYIKDFITCDVYKKSDILNVIHLVDMDGAYIKDDLILQKNHENSKSDDSIEYSTENIYAKNIENIKSRNKQKSQILSKLAATDTVYGNLSYGIYFFSSNLEHVMHNRQCVLSHEKRKYAHMFEDKFAQSPLAFVEFMNDSEFALTGDYDDTWDFIKKDVNSLKRYTNFNLYLNTIKTE
ncbi:MAG: hypothetical protein ACREVX_05530 [Clostridium sp.]|uniref:hypothetical protein n=1 Tax=Clostridium sp. TaxID=1506 RepID=UPI003D6C8634